MFWSTVKPVLSGHSKRRPNIGFQDQLSLNAGQKYCRILQGEHSPWSILQYFLPRPALSYHLLLEPLFCLFWSDRFRQVYCYHLSLRSLFCLFLSGHLRQVHVLLYFMFLFYLFFRRELNTHRLQCLRE